MDIREGYMYKDCVFVCVPCCIQFCRNWIYLNRKLQRCLCVMKEKQLNWQRENCFSFPFFFFSISRFSSSSSLYFTFAFLYAFFLSLELRLIFIHSIVEETKQISFGIANFGGSFLSLLFFALVYFRLPK